MKCRKSTSTKNEKKATSANGRNMLKGNCANCGTAKTKFISGSSKPIPIPKKKQSGGLYNQDNRREIPESEFIEEKPKKMKAKKDV
jgi:hypothetical protein